MTPKEKSQLDSMIDGGLSVFESRETQVLPVSCGRWTLGPPKNVIKGYGKDEIILLGRFFEKMEIYRALQGTTFKSPPERTTYRHLKNVINKSKEPLSPEEKTRLDAMITSGSLFERDDSGGGGQDSGAPLGKLPTGGVPLSSTDTGGGDQVPGAPVGNQQTEGMPPTPNDSGSGGGSGGGQDPDGPFADPPTRSVLSTPTNTGDGDQVPGAPVSNQPTEGMPPTPNDSGSGGGSGGGQDPDSPLC